MRPRVAVVGFQKTGTTSLQHALEYLGYRVARTTTESFRAAWNADLDTLRVIASKFDAVQDFPWFLYVRELDDWFPGTKFVLTVRDEDDWMQSWRSHFDDEANPQRMYDHSRRLVFGDVPRPAFDEAPYRERYRSHNLSVVEYFSERPGDLLVLNVGAGDEWKQLCAHLGIPVPVARSANGSFPRANPSLLRDDPIARRRARRLRWIRSIVTRLGGEGLARELGRARRRWHVRTDLRKRG